MPASGKEDSERGPSWFDVWRLQRDMELHHGKRIDLFFNATPSASKLWGLRVSARFTGQDVPYGHGSYGPLYPGNGSRTVAAAVYRALFALDSATAQTWLDSMETRQMDIFAESSE